MPALVRELIGSHPGNLATVLKGVVSNELGQFRTPSNMALISMMVHSWPEETAKVHGLSVHCNPYTSLYTISCVNNVFELKKVLHVRPKLLFAAVLTFFDSVHLLLYVQCAFLCGNYGRDFNRLRHAVNNGSVYNFKF